MFVYSCAILRNLCFPPPLTKVHKYCTVFCTYCIKEWNTCTCSGYGLKSRVRVNVPFNLPGVCNNYICRVICKPMTKVTKISKTQACVCLLKGKSLFVKLHWKKNCLLVTAAGNRPKSVHAKPKPLAVTKHTCSHYVESRGFILRSRSK